MANKSLKQEAARTGTAVSGLWGGPGYKRYFLPTGEEIYGIPRMVGNDYGGTRDANLDKGWSLSLPTELKVACPGCTKWHDTEEEVDACVETRTAQVARWQKEDDDVRAEKNNAEQNNVDVEERLGKLEEGLDKLEEGLSDIKDDIKTLLQLQLGAKNG